MLRRDVGVSMIRRKHTVLFQMLQQFIMVGLREMWPMTHDSAPPERYWKAPSALPHVFSPCYSVFQHELWSWGLSPNITQYNHLTPISSIWLCLQFSPQIKSFSHCWCVCVANVLNKDYNFSNLNSSTQLRNHASCFFLDFSLSEQKATRFWIRRLDKRINSYNVGSPKAFPDSIVL